MATPALKVPPAKTTYPKPISGTLLTKESISGLQRGLKAFRAQYPTTARGWHLATFNPMTIFDLFPNLGLDPDHRVDVFQYGRGADTEGQCLVLPGHFDLPDIPPEPHHPFPSDPMAARSVVLTDMVESKLRPKTQLCDSLFFEASIYIREFQEMGSTGRFAKWQRHQLMAEETVEGVDPDGKAVNLSLAPTVVMESRYAVVQFFSWLGDCVLAHTDIWSRNLCLLSSLEERFATGYQGKS